MGIKEILEKIETCAGCNKQFTFEERLFPMELKKCQKCGRLLCPKCWGHTHLMAWRYCIGCQPQFPSEPLGTAPREEENARS